MHDQDYHCLREECEASGEHFTDPEFTPTSDSLCKDAGKFEAKFSVYEWQRVSELSSLTAQGTVALFKDSIEPSDIVQGALGDCYFLSCLAALAEKPDRIRKLFESLETSEHGIYGVKMTKNGRPLSVVLDEWIPTRYDKPAFS